MLCLKRNALFGTITSVLVMIQLLVIFRLANLVAIPETSKYAIIPQSTATVDITNKTAITLAIDKSTELPTPIAEADNAERITKMITPKPEQKVILLAGPHKTGSTSIQTNLFNWLHNNTHPSKLSQFWSWPSPVERFKRAGCNETFKGMEFYPIIYQWTRAMRGPELAKRYEIKCMFSRDGQQLLSIPQYLAFYKKEFHHIWMRGRGIVIASEALDIIGAPQAGPMVLERTIRQFPWHTDYVPAANGTDYGNIIAVVTYRSPRSTHLQSMWHECCMEHESFRDYLLSFTEKTTMHHLDSLNLAYKFLMRGIKTVLIDLAGVLEKGYDLSNVVACDILGAVCTPEKHFFGDETKERPIIANAKSKKHTVTLEQMELIDEAIEDYECNFLLMLGHRDLTILYPFALKRLVEKCRGMKSQSTLDIKSLKQKIAEIAKQS